MKTFAKLTLMFVIAVLAATFIASVFSSQFVIAGLQGIGVNVSMPERIGMTIDDLAILQTLGMAIAAAFLLGFLVAGFCVRLMKSYRQLWFIAAGASSVIVMLLIMSAVLSIMPIAGARTTLGLICQGVAGGIGGWVFAKLTPKPI